MKKILFVLVVLFASCSNDVGRYEYCGFINYKYQAPNGEHYFLAFENQGRTSVNLDLILEEYGELNDTTLVYVFFDTKKGRFKFDKYELEEFYRYGR